MSCIAAAVPNTVGLIWWGLHVDLAGSESQSHAQTLELKEPNSGIKGTDSLWQGWESVLWNLRAARPASKTAVLKDEMNAFVLKTSQPDATPAIFHTAFCRQRVTTETWAN